MKKFLTTLSALLVATMFWVPTLANAQYGPIAQQSQTYVATFTATVQPTVPESSLYNTHAISWITTGTAVGSVQLQTCTTALTASCSNMTNSVSGNIAASGTMTVGNTTEAFGAFTMTLSTCTGCSVQVTYYAYNTSPIFTFLSANNCGLLTACAPVGTNNFRILFGSCVASAATTCTVTAMPSWTSSSSYFCAASDATTAANAIFKITYASATSFVITDANSSSDIFNYMCWGT